MRVSMFGGVEVGGVGSRGCLCIPVGRKVGILLWGVGRVKEAC